MTRRSLFVRDLRPGDYAELFAFSDERLVISVCSCAEKASVRLTVLLLSGLVNTFSLPASDSAWLILAESL